LNDEPQSVGIHEDCFLDPHLSFRAFLSLARERIKVRVAGITKFKIEIWQRRRTIPHMKIATIIARVLLGLIFVFFGSNPFLHFLPMPPLPGGTAGLYLKAFFDSGYVYVIAGMQLIGGLLLLVGRFVPLGLTILAAIIFNIWAFHILMAPEGFPPAAVVTLLEVFLIWRYREPFAGLLKP